MKDSECEAKSREDKWIKEGKYDATDEDYIWIKEVISRNQIKDTELIEKQIKYLELKQEKAKDGEEKEDKDASEDTKEKFDQDKAEEQMKETYFSMINRMRQPFNEG